MRAGLLITLILACNTATDPPMAPNPTTTTPAVPSPSLDCATRVAAMRRAIAHVPVDATVVPAQSHMQFPASRRGQKITTKVAVWLHVDGDLDFEPDRSASLAEILPRLQAALAPPAVPSPATLLLIADRRVPTATIRGLVEALPPATNYVLAVQPADHRAATPPPIPPWVAGSLDLQNIPRAEHPPRIGDATDRALGDCAAARDAYDVSASNSAEMVDILVHRLPDGLAACGCGTADVEALTAIVWTMVGNPGPPLLQISLSVTRDLQAESVNVTTVGELAALVETRGDRPFRLAP